MKLATWNVNSLNVRLPRLLDWLAANQPDAMGLQETKLEDARFPAVEIAAAGYQAIFYGQRTYNGVAILSRLPAADVRPRLTRRDWRGAFGVCILVILSTFPVVIPFIVVEDARSALRISNALAVTLIFLCGLLFGRHTGLSPWITGLIMAAVGVVLVSIAIALGG